MSSRADRRRGGRVVALALLALVAASVVGASLGHRWARGAIASRALLLAERHGVSLDIAAARIDLGWRRITLRDVGIRHVSVHGRVGRIDVDVGPWHEWVWGRLQARALRVRGGELSLARGEGAEQGTSASRAEGRTTAATSPLVITVEQVGLRTPAGLLEVEEAEIRRASGGWQAEGRAMLESPLGRLGVDVIWRGRSASIRASAGDGWRLDLPSLGPREIRVGSLSVSLEPPELRAEGVRVGGLLAMEEVSVTAHEGGWRAEGRGLALEDTPLVTDVHLDRFDLRLGAGGTPRDLKAEGLRARVDAASLRAGLTRLVPGGAGGASEGPAPDLGVRRLLTSDAPCSLSGGRVELPDVGLTLEGLELSREGAAWSLTARLEGASRVEGVFSGRVSLDGSGVARAHVGYAGCLVPRVAEARLAEAGVALLSACQDDAEVDLTVGADGIEADGRLRVAGWTLEAPGLATAPVQGVGAEARFSARVDRALRRGRLRVDPLSLGPLRVTFETAGDGEGAAPRVALDVDLPKQACDNLLRGFPPSLLPELEGMWLAGEVEAALRYRVDFARVYAMYEARAEGREEPYQSELEISGDERCRVTSWPRGIDPRALLAPDFVHEWPLGDEGETVRVGPGAPGFVPLGEIPASVRRGALATEDLRFYEHAGVNPGLVRTALEMDVHAGRFKYGGSTITQQLVKNLYLTRTKTIARKIEEALLALALERVVPKDRILEIYLNVIEFGRGVYGIGAAAWHYFGVPVQALRPEEAAFLMTCKPSPADCQRLLDRGRGLGPAWTKKVDFVLDRLHRLVHVLTDEEVRDARAREIRFRRGPLPGAGGLLPDSPPVSPALDGG